MLRFKAWTFIIIFTVIARFHGNGVLCSDNDTANANGNVIEGLNLIPDCILGANKVNFYLWNSHVSNGVILDVNSDDIPITNSSKYITILVHGFTSEANNTDYDILIKSWLQKRPDNNVFSVDWKQGACSDGLTILQLLSYPQAVSNIREVASMIAEFVEKLMQKHDIELENFGLVGHSLGAHVVGFAGKHLQTTGVGKLPWIIALDAAGPGFQINRCEDRLCESDAEIVQTFHTSVGTGSLRRFGNIELYFNGGVTQPGCSATDVSCSHSKSVEYFSDTIWDEKKYLAKRWTRFSSRPTSDSCTEETCTIPGLLALKLPARGTFWVDVPVNSTR